MFNASREGSRSTRYALLAVTSVIFLLLGACSMHQVADHELEDIGRHETLQVEKAMHQVQMAMVATRAYFEHRHVEHDTGLVLDSAEVTVNASHIDTGSGNFTLVLAGGGQGQATASSKLKFTLQATTIPDIDSWPSGDEATAIRTAMHRFRKESSLACAQSSQPAQAAGTSTMETWESIARVAVAGLDGYLCSVRQTGSSALTEFDVTVSIKTDDTATEGVVFKLGAWSIGSTETEESDDIMQVVLKFTRL